MLDPIKIERPSKALVEKLKKTSSATAWSVLRSKGIHSVFLDGLIPLISDQKMVGPAQTIKYLPRREDKVYP
ncbi:MAG: hypothetical protein ACXAEX_21905, partial [Promethearchaeota archaeon]